MAPLQPSLHDLGTAIRMLRHKKGLTIDELAVASCMHATYVSRIERAETNATWIKLCGLAAALGTTPSKLALAAEREAARRQGG